MLGNLGDERIRERKLGKKAGFEKESLKEDAHKSFHKIMREKNVFRQLAFLKLVLVISTVTSSDTRASSETCSHCWETNFQG